MKKITVIAVTLVFVLTTLFAPASVFAEDWVPIKSVDISWFDYNKVKKTYKIENEAQLRGLASLVDEEQNYWKPNHTEDFEGVEFILEKDIKLKNRWTPIGLSSAAPFKGVFNGNGHKITNLIVYPDYEYVGLFGSLAGEVKDLTVDGTIVSYYPNTGSIAGSLERGGTISKCTSTVTVQGKEMSGGIAGQNRGGSIDHCMNYGTISGTFDVGGICGENFGGMIAKSGNHGEVYTTERNIGTYGTGGIAGRSVGGNSSITDCYNKGRITSATETTGGITGYMNARGAKLIDCYNTGDLVVKAPETGNKKTKSYLGGIVGSIGNGGIQVANCYNMGNSHGADVSGGIIGSYYDDNGIRPSRNIDNNYYISTDFKYGIGSTSSGKGANIQNCATGISLGSLSTYAPKLSDSYMKDASGLFGNGGNPVLRWQKPISEEDREYVQGISISAQKRLDKYMQKHTDSIMAGQIVLDIFNTTNLLSDSLFD